MMPQFDPYDLLIQLDARLNNLERAHNKMAHAYQQSEQELTVALHSLKHLQQLVATQTNRIKILSTELAQLNKSVSN